MQIEQAFRNIPTTHCFAPFNPLDFSDTHNQIFFVIKKNLNYSLIFMLICF